MYRYPRPPSSEITPRHVFEPRRSLMKGMAAGAVLGGIGTSPALLARELGDVTETGFGQDLSPTPLDAIRGYSNFYEFGTDKDDPREHAHQLQTDPWSVRVDGLVDNPGTFAVEDLINRFQLEERIYRLRCVEAWSMVIPWIGFELRQLLKAVQPTSEARFVVFETLHDPEQMPGQKKDLLDWPYREGLRLDEAMHPLTLMAVGLYDDPLPKENGAPIRLVVPWKYGFKSIKSVVRIRLQKEQPTSSWQAVQPEEYGFYANVNPNVKHPRWHQATERRVGETGRRKTLMFNGYESEVADLYKGMDLEKHF